MVAVASLLPSVVSESAELRELRQQVREFIADELAAQRFTPTVDSWVVGWDDTFSRRLAAQGWLGVTIPTEYGGHGGSFLQRFVITEELLAAGAPVAAHWIADRQVAPSILKFGTEEQKQKFLPEIAAGRCFFGIGMSEPDSGSDLASVRAKGTRVDGGWKVSGTKVWTSWAHRSDYFIALVRTEPRDENNRHAGLSQFIVDLKADGVDIRPITSIGNHHHFNEVFLDEVFVPDEMVFGEIGDGWHQVTSELAFERSGPERYLSPFPLFAEALDVIDGNEQSVGQTTGRLFALHQMSLAVAGALQRGESVETTAALYKVIGTMTEGDVVEQAALLAAESPELADRIAKGLLQRPGFTLRGGTVEVLTGVVARGLGVR